MSLPTLLVIAPMAEGLGTKYACWRSGPPLRAALIPRLGTLRLPAQQERELRAAVEELRRRCPPGARVYVGAHRFAHVPFLADRAAVGPFALSYLAVTRAERVAAAAALERERPSVALLAADGIDLPYREEHPEEWAVLAARYREARRFGEFSLWVRTR